MKVSFGGMHMIGSLKVVGCAAVLFAAAQTSLADHPGAVIGNVRPPGPSAAAPGPAGTMVRPASNAAGSPPIYYSNQQWVPPSITPPNLNLTPSWGYSTGFYIPQFQSAPTTFNPIRPAGPTVGPGFGPSFGLGVGVTYSPMYYSPPMVVNQYYYTPQPAYNYTTNIRPRRLTYGVLNR
jgi:hypothetical protein